MARTVPRELYTTTDAAGQTSFTILPSSELTPVSNYVLSLRYKGAYVSKIFTMPDQDSDLHDLADVTPVTPGGTTPGTGGGAIAIEDEGILVTATAMTIDFVGAGVTATRTGGEVRVLIPGVTGGGGGTPAGDVTVFFGLSVVALPTAAVLTIAATNGVGSIDSYSGSRYLLIARLATEADISSVLFSDDASNTNQVGAFTKFGSTLIPPGQTEAFNVWYSNQNLTQPDDVTITVR